MLAALLGVPLLGLPRSYATLGEHGHALAVDDAPVLTDRSILRSLSQGVRECSAGRRGAAKECLAAVREAAHRWLYTTPEGPDSAALHTSSNRRKLSTCAKCGQKKAAALNCCSDGGAWEGLCEEGGEHDWHEGFQACRMFADKAESDAAAAEAAEENMVAENKAAADAMTAEADAAAVKQAAADVARAKEEDAAAADRAAAAEKALADAADAAAKERDEAAAAAEEQAAAKAAAKAAEDAAAEDAAAEEQAAAKAAEDAAAEDAAAEEQAAAKAAKDAAAEDAAAEEQAATKAAEDAAAEEKAAAKAAEDAAAEKQAAADAAKTKANAAAEDLAVRPVSIRHPWRALGENWWMPFVDGWAHQCGATVFDQSATLTRLEGDGMFSTHLKSQHDKFSDYELMHATHLNIDMVESMNMELQGLSWDINPEYGSWEVACPYTDWQPRKAVGAKHDVVGYDMMGYTGAVTFADKAKIWSDAMATQDYSKDRDLYWKIREKLIGRPLDAFEAAITKDDCGIARWTSNARERLSLEQHHPRAALGCLLPAAATLYGKMAELHPFIDGNSRTRIMMLNIQLARAGAHPVVLYNNGWAAYHMNNLEELEEYLLGGYCAWEYVMATGKSPYVGPTPSFDCAKPPYENHTDMRYMGANRSPIPLYDKEKDECILPQRLRSRA